MLKIDVNDYNKDSEYTSFDSNNNNVAATQERI
jgi:hypothetical protein